MTLGTVINRLNDKQLALSGMLLVHLGEASIDLGDLRDNPSSVELADSFKTHAEMLVELATQLLIYNKLAKQLQEKKKPAARGALTAREVIDDAE